MANRWRKMETVTDFIFLGFKISADGDCTQEIKRRLLLGRKAMTYLESVSKSRDIQRVPYRLNQRRNTSRHTLIKLTEIKHKERILKAARKKQQVTYNRKPIRLTADLSEKLYRPEGNGRIYLKY